jgi:hypothetical protein
MATLQHNKGAARSKAQATLGLALTHGNDDFVTGLRIQASRGAKVVFGLI